MPVAPMRRCVITCCLDKSDCFGIETCYVFHCAAVSSLDIFGTTDSAPEKNLAGSLGAILHPSIIKTAVPMMTQRRSETHSTSICQYDLICLDSKL